MFKTSLKCSIVLKIHWKIHPGACPHCATPCTTQCLLKWSSKQMPHVMLPQTCQPMLSFLRNFSSSDQLKEENLVTQERCSARACSLCPYSMLHKHKAQNLKWVFPPLVTLVHLVPPHCVYQTVPQHWVCTSLQSASSSSLRKRASQEQPRWWPGHRGWL